MRKLAATLVLLPLPAVAAPDSTTQYFMNEPASLFDLGMYRLETFGNRTGSSMTLLYAEGAELDIAHTAGKVTATYDPDADMIYVAFSVADEIANAQKMENGCRAVLRTLRIDVSKSVWRMFSHYGQPRNATSQATLEAFYDKFELRCWVHDKVSDGRFWASVPLEGDFGGTADMKTGKWHTGND